MKKSILILTFIFVLGIKAEVLAQVWVDPYVKKDGTYVQGHMRSSPNNSTLDNYGTRGNTNPYTGQMGTRDPYKQNYNPYQNQNQNNQRRNW